MALLLKCERISLWNGWDHKMWKKKIKGGQFLGFLIPIHVSVKLKAECLDLLSLLENLWEIKSQMRACVPWLLFHEASAHWKDSH